MPSDRFITKYDNAGLETSQEQGQRNECQDQVGYNLEGDGDTGSGVLLHRRQCASGGLGYCGELVELQDNDVLLQREGWTVDHQRVYRRYCQEGLMLRTKKPRRYVSGQRSMERPVAAGVDETWPMDFMSDELFDGRRNWLLTIVENFTRESLAIPILTCPVAASIKRAGVVEVLHQLMRQHRLPQTIRVNNGPEFTSQCLD